MLRKLLVGGAGQHADYFRGKAGTGCVPRRFWGFRRSTLGIQSNPACTSPSWRRRGRVRMITTVVDNP